MLNGFRALDLTDRTGFFCGKILAQFGVDVIKVETPSGDPARNLAPFYHDVQNPEKSLYWFAYNDGKRGITLDIETKEGRLIFKKLVATSDFVVESFPVGYMENLGLGYKSMSEINPGLIMASITPFGQTGPYKTYKATDLVAMALGGIMIQTGESEGPPCRLHPDHTYCLAGAGAAMASILAWYHRERTGDGQYIDVSMYESVLRENYREIPVSWEFERTNVKRNGGNMFRAKVFTRCIWPCKDGHITWTIFGGKVGATDNKALAQWMEEEGVLGNLKDINWDEFDLDSITQDEISRIEDHILKLTKRHTKRELEDGAIERGIRISAVNDVRDLCESRQLKFRDFWSDLEHPEIPDVIRYPGQLFLSNEVKIGPGRRAPLIGENNEEIYEAELGYDQETLQRLKREGVI